MKTVEQRFYLLVLPFALAGFALAQPVYHLLLQTPEFLVARQSTAAEVRTLVMILSLAIPLLAGLPAWLAWKRWPQLASAWGWLACGVLAALFFGQLFKPVMAAQTFVYLAVSLACGLLLAWILLFSAWTLLGRWLAAIACVFPLWFLVAHPPLEQLDSFADAPLKRTKPSNPLPHVVFLVLDELPLATLLNNDLDIDAGLFPGFARLQSMSTWFSNTTSVSDGTIDAVPSMLIGRYPTETSTRLIFEMHPHNLFTYLRGDYQFNVAESVTRLCPQALCPRSGAPFSTRAIALLLDIAAVFMHRVAPDAWAKGLPEVTSNWSGFFAARQRFFPKSWMTTGQKKAAVDWPGFIRQFTASIHYGKTPTFNYVHAVFPHGPYAYLPGGENYGVVWMRGADKKQWGNVEWGIISGKQRHYLQVQYADRLLDELLDHLQDQQMLDDTLLVVVADHGTNFTLNEPRRALTKTNAAAMLRVPLFIRLPGQSSGQRIDAPVETIDLVPTLLSALDYDASGVVLDGFDILSGEPARERQRFANSYLDRRRIELDESRLGLAGLVSDNRAQLKLDDPESALWEIGPYDHLRGQDMSVVCKTSDEKIRVLFDALRELDSADPATTIPAYVSGKFSGKATTLDSRPFLVTSNGKIAGSGHTWPFIERPHFFALVEPRFVQQPDWSPRAWVVEDGACLGD